MNITKKFYVLILNLTLNYYRCHSHFLYTSTIEEISLRHLRHTFIREPVSQEGVFQKLNRFIQTQQLWMRLKAETLLLDLTLDYSLVSSTISLVKHVLC